MSTDGLHAQQKKKITLIAALVNLGLAAGKTSCGIIAQSEALVADGIHSLSDVLTDIITVIAVKLAAKDADTDHPYGHARFETLATVVLGMILMTAAAGILVSAVERLYNSGSLIVPGLLAFLMTVLSILANECLYHYTMRIAHDTHSQLLKANAWHHRSDSISSIVVLLGLMVTLTGFGVADAIAASVVALMVAKVGYGLIVSSILELVDTALPEKLVSELRNVVLTTDGVTGVHRLRTRRMGSEALADVHILVNPRISVSEGHLIADNVRNRLQDKLEELSEVLVHVDPEDDDTVDQYDHCQSLPQRSTITGCINKLISQLEWPDQVEDVKLHYLKGYIEVELILSRSTMLENIQHQRQVEKQLSSAIMQIGYVSSVKVYYN